MSGTSDVDADTMNRHVAKMVEEAKTEENREKDFVEQFDEAVAKTEIPLETPEDVLKRVEEESKPVINSEVTAILAKIAEEAAEAEKQNAARIKAKKEENDAKAKFEEQEIKLNETQEEYETEQKRLLQAKEDNEEQKRIGNQLRDNVNAAVDTLKGYTRQAINDTNEALNNTQRYNTETTDMKNKELKLVEDINSTSQERDIISIDTENKMKENELLGSALESINPYLEPVNVDEELAKEEANTKVYA